MQRIAVILLCVCALHTSGLAQRINQWKGGQPGRETDWNCAQNWTLGRVPDWTVDVVIPDVSTRTHHYPIVRGGSFEAGSLVLHPYAELTVAEDARLVIAGANAFATGIWNDGLLILSGKLAFEDSPLRRAGTYGGRGQLEQPGALTLADQP
jgi:hypothetical protein